MANKLKWGYTKNRKKRLKQVFEVEIFTVMAKKLEQVNLIFRAANKFLYYIENNQIVEILTF